MSLAERPGNCGPRDSGENPGGRSVERAGEPLPVNDGSRET